MPMKQHRKPPRRPNLHTSGNRKESPKGKRGGQSPQGGNGISYSDEAYESAVAPQSSSELEAYLADQMRVLIHARQEQERALRQIRALGEQLAQNDGSNATKEQYSRAVALWQSSRRNGVNARQRLLFAMSEKLMPEGR
jgi:hypothetical protein